MKQNKQFILLVLAFSLMSPCVAHEQVQTAAKAALENVTGGNLGKLYKVRSQAETPDLREMIVKACVAGLYAIGDTKNAKKINQGEDRDGFIDSLMKECDLCHGERCSQEDCYKCKGSGACQNRKCNNGTVTSAGFDGRSNVRKCSNCGGFGKCTNCKGTGKVARTCSRCNGSKKVIDKSIALASCKDMLNALIACGNEIQSRKKAEGATQLAQQMVEKEKQAREKAESSARLVEQNAKFKEKLAKIASERKCIDDYCEIIANGLTVGVVKRKPEGFNYTVAGKCNGVASTRLYYKNRWGETLTEDVGWSHDFSYLILSDEDEWANWMDALKVVHEKVIEWVDVAVKNDIDKMEKEIPIGRIEVLAHNNMVTKGKGQQELYVSAIRERERPDTPVKFFCKMSRSDYQKDKGEHSGGVTARCGYFEHEILRFSGDKTRISNDILLLIERYNPAALKKAYLEHARKQDMFK